MMLSDTSPPRLSFSHDLGQADSLPRRDVSLLDMNCDFEFSINRSFRPDEPSSADELFSHGVIKAMQPKDRSSLEDAAPKARDIHHLYSLPPLPSPQSNTKKESTTQLNTDVNASEDMDQQNSNNNNNTKPQSKSFWGFKRSSSLNQDSKKSLLCSLPEFLRRSNSTGSAPNPKKSTTVYKDAHGQQKRQSSSSVSSTMSMSKSSSASSSSSSSNQYRMLPRPPSRKGQGNGVRISPVLNVPSPYISRGTAKLFCLSSFLYPTEKEKKQKN